MEKSRIIGNVLFVAVGTIAYYVMATIVCDSLPYAAVPSWWRSLWPSSDIGAMSWLSAMDLTSAFASAAGVAVISFVMLKHARAKLGFLVGALCATFVAIHTAVQYKPFSSGSTTVVLVVQFLAFAFAAPFTIKVIEICALTIGSWRRA